MEAQSQQLTTVTNDLKELHSQNQQLTTRVSELEQQNSQMSAMKKRGCPNSPGPNEGKRRRQSFEDSLLLFDDEIVSNDSGNFDGSSVQVMVIPLLIGAYFVELLTCQWSTGNC